MARLWKLLVVPLILMVLVGGVTLTDSHDSKLFLLNNMKPIDIWGMEFLYSNSDKQDAVGNNYTVNYYRLSFKANQDIKNMSIVAIGLDQNNRRLTLPDSIIFPKTQPFNYIVHSNSTISQGKIGTVELVYASNGNQNLKSLQFYVYDESKRLNNLVSEYTVPVVINKTFSGYYYGSKIN
ncbi:MAG: hypothetical protein LBC39_08665 [Methanobrevibacter sp.]|jgi:hypothetical protein|nr:hypothetical protein [Candidatus Methanovirga aequatorialis]